MAEVSGKNELERFADYVRQRFPKVTAAIDAAAAAGDVWFLDIAHRDAHVVVEWRRGFGFGVTRFEGDLSNYYGAGHDIVVADRAAAERLLEELLGPDASSGATRPMVDFPAASILLGLTPLEAENLARELTRAEEVLRGEEMSIDGESFDFEERVRTRLDWLRLSMPAHEVAVEAFSIDVYPVTIAQWKAYMRETGAAPPSSWTDNQAPHPGSFFVTGVSWHEVSAYARHYGLDLPTEAEWELAARHERDFFPWGNEYFPQGRTVFQEPVQEPYPVGSRPGTASRSGVQDLVGYFGEFTCDLLRPYPGAAVTAFDAHYPGWPAQRAVRGGFDVHQDATCVYRSGIGENDRPRWLKFRCVRRAR
jgi:formylglycine-generating enzyme required for sulfatase activity